MPSRDRTIQLRAPACNAPKLRGTGTARNHQCCNSLDLPLPSLPPPKALFSSHLLLAAVRPALRASSGLSAQPKPPQPPRLNRFPRSLGSTRNRICQRRDLPFPSPQGGQRRIKKTLPSLSIGSKDAEPFANRPGQKTSVCPASYGPSSLPPPPSLHLP